MNASHLLRVIDLMRVWCNSPTFRFKINEPGREVLWYQWWHRKSDPQKALYNSNNSLFFSFILYRSISLTCVLSQKVGVTQPCKHMVLIIPCWATGLRLSAKMWKGHRSTCGIHSRWDPDEHRTKILADQPLVLLEYPYPPDFRVWPGLCPWPKMVQKNGCSLMLRGPLEPAGAKIT